MNKKLLDEFVTDLAALFAKYVDKGVDAASLRRSADLYVDTLRQEIAKKP